MQKLILAAAATIALVGAPLSVAAAADGQDAHHHHARHRTTGVSPSYAPYVQVNPGVRDGYVMNGAFDWRRLRPGQQMPWYAHGYSDDCVAWTPNAYHYACDPNNRY